MTDQIDDMVKERGSVHGEFRDVAQVDTNLNLAMKESVNWRKLQPYQQVALKMIAHKIARILSGDPSYDDHWKDIEGYTRITRDRLPKTAGTSTTAGVTGEVGVRG